MTVRETLVQGSSVLKASGIESASLDASLLLAEIMGINRAALIASGTRQLADEELDKFNALIRRRQSGECTAYILEKKEFYGLEFSVNPAVLVPRPDTETLVEIACKKLEQWSKSPGAAPGRGNLRVLDLCTGSGAVAIALKHQMPELEVWAADISAQAMEIAEANAECLRGVQSSSVHFRRGNLFDALVSGGANGQEPEPVPLFSLIVSNPPYIPSPEISSLAREVQNEPRLALDGGCDGLDIIRTIVKKAPAFLYAGGALLLEADPRQMESVAALLEQAGFVDVQTYPDLSGRQRVIHGEIHSPAHQPNALASVRW